MCSNGTMQSPIDLFDLRVQAVSQLEKIRKSYKPSTATLKNRGHDIMLKWRSGAAGFIEINRTRYLLQQCHWHSPSEHTVNGRRFDLELHIVHQSRTGQIAVIGIMYRIGMSDSFLSAMASRIRAIANSTKQERTVAGVVDPRRRIRISSKQYYKYIGSLTVPPCT
ncbi:hypothetical protein TIFTF001_008960 [Ficus carica]|uniref:Carbonic anhydrase n=1 Tax=Ficus carica TaxID=3494 RepID=A0AA88CYJ0_FICCA|nr:hypothetical protein TIFTF001_008960 [Ficus carica]